MPGRTREEKTPRLSRPFYWVILVVFLFDQLTKYLALHYLNPWESYPIIRSVFHLTLVHNTGIAFGFFRKHPEILLGFISLSLVFLFVWGIRQKNFSNLQSIVFGMILGGALGNWLDRVRFGAVIDFLDFRIWPVFNIADSAITIGVCILALQLLRKSSP